ncbi:glycosyltransferase family 2 protein, partial [Streptomyces misionensis]
MTATGTPRVSVVCPTYNRSRAITRTIDSVRAQTVGDWELLVVSDGCDDDTEDWVARAAAEDPRVRLLRVARTGHPSGPRNAGLAAARGAYIAYLDHDDTWHPHHLRVALGLLETGAPSPPAASRHPQPVATIPAPVSTRPRATRRRCGGQGSACPRLAMDAPRAAP